LGAKQLKISIQAYWGADIRVLPKSADITPEERIREGKKINICDVIIDNKLVGSIMWDGTKLTVG